MGTSSEMQNDTLAP